LFSSPYWKQSNIYKPVFLARTTKINGKQNTGALWQSWRTADVADAFTPTTGTYLMNVYSIFKEQPACLLGCEKIVAFFHSSFY